MFKIISTCTAVLLFAACAQADIEGVGSTVVNLDTCIPVPDKPCIPMKIAWNSGTAKGYILFELYHPETGELLMKYEARDVTQPEEFMAILAEVKLAIVEAQTDLASDAVDAIAGSVMGLILRPGI